MKFAHRLILALCRDLPTYSYTKHRGLIKPISLVQKLLLLQHGVKNNRWLRDCFHHQACKNSTIPSYNADSIKPMKNKHK